MRPYAPGSQKHQGGWLLESFSSHPKGTNRGWGKTRRLRKDGVSRETTSIACATAKGSESHVQSVVTLIFSASGTGAQKGPSVSPFPGQMNYASVRRRTCVEGFNFRPRALNCGLRGEAGYDEVHPFLLDLGDLGDLPSFCLFFSSY